LHVLAVYIRFVTIFETKSYSIDSELHGQLCCKPLVLILIYSGSSENAVSATNAVLMPQETALCFSCEQQQQQQCTHSQWRIKDFPFSGRIRYSLFK